MTSQMKNWSVIILLLGFISLLNAQTASDALRYSYLNPSGTARTIGAGNSLGALGADYSATYSNPAGLANFRSSEFVFTPSLLTNNTTAQLIAQNTSSYEEKKTKFALDNLGLILVNRPRSGKWSTINFGLGINNMARYNQQSYFRGTTKGSITDRFLANAQGTTYPNLDDYESGLAYETGAIFLKSGTDNQYKSDFSSSIDTLVDKQQFISTSGNINEFTLNLAGNFDEKFMIGATIGVPFVTFTEEKTYKETDPNNTNPTFTELSFTEKLTTTGTGINLKLGFIYKLNPVLRLGLAAHTPTAYALSDSYANEMSYKFVQAGKEEYHSAKSPDGSFEYTLNTPWRFVGSMGFLFAKTGFLSGEVEYINYGASRFSFKNANTSDKDYEREINSNIGTKYTSAVNVRFGGEYALDIFRFRAGVGILNQPFKGDDNLNYMYSAGIGMRYSRLFADIAYRNTSVKESYLPYIVAQAAQPSVNTKTKVSNFILTIGYKF